MIIFRGKEKEEINDLKSLISGYKNIVVDIGTGNGCFVYRMAKRDFNTYFIGIDPVADNFIPFASKIIKKRSRGGLTNVLYIVASVEDLPNELDNCANKIYIILPWGSLLEGIVKGNPKIIKNIRRISAIPEGELEFIVTYSNLIEEAEIKNKKLPRLSLDYFTTRLLPLYQKHGITFTKINMVTQDALKNLDTQWAKKLGYGKLRTIYWLKGIIHKSGN